MIQRDERIKFVVAVLLEMLFVSAFAYCAFLGTNTHKYIYIYSKCFPPRNRGRTMYHSIATMIIVK